MKTPTPPANPEAEKHVLGAVFWDAKLIHDVTTKLSPDDFFWEEHRDVYDAMRSANERKVAIHISSIADEMERAGTLEKLGGMSALAALSEFGIEHRTISENIDIVRRKAAHRRLIAAAQQIVSLGLRDGDDDRVSFAEAQRLLLEADRGTEDNREYSMQRMTDEFYDEYAKAKDQKGRTFQGISTGIAPLDEILQGMHAGEFIVVAGRSSMGKSAFGLSLAHSVADQGKRVLVFSFEMLSGELYHRLMATRSQVDSYKLRAGTTDDREDRRVSDQLDAIRTVPLTVIRSSGYDMTKIRATVLRLQAKQGVDLVLIDYIGLIRTYGFKDKWQAVSAVSNACKDLAQECRIPVVALAQINRNTEGRTDKRPSLGDIRGSGSIEEDCDAALLLYRPWYYDKTADPLLTQVSVAKHRNGPVGDVELDFDPSTSTFAERGHLPSAIRSVQPRLAA